MHPILDRDRFQNCEDLIDALEECHRLPYLDTLLGKCSDIKLQLSTCLHENRLANDRIQILKRQEKNKQLEISKKKREEEEWGENGYLKKVIELEYQQKMQKNNSDESKQ
jgi:COX assembly protein 2